MAINRDKPDRWKQDVAQSVHVQRMVCEICTTSVPNDSGADD